MSDSPTIRGANSGQRDRGDPAARLLTAAEVAVRLSLHVKTVLRYVRTAGLPACRLPGGDLRFIWPEVSEWLDGRKEVNQ